MDHSRHTHPGGDIELTGDDAAKTLISLRDGRDEAGLKPEDG
jgi:hypothetical protein